VNAKFIGGMLLIGISVGLCVWLLTRPRDIRFVLPASFDGPFIVVLDERGSDMEVIDGLFVVTVGPTRVVKVRSFKPFAGWHNESWTMVDSRNIIHESDFVAPDDAVTLRPVGLQSCGNSDQRLKYFFGKMPDAEAFDFCSIPLL
jgi:hypothetical protein